MINTTELLLNAEFALAAYATLNNGTLDNDEQREALEAAGMSEVQANNFASNYSVVTQFNDTETSFSATETSFSATVFKDTSGNLTLGIRGTLELVGSPNDIIPTDADIAFNGAGYDQIVAMYNWWQRVSTPAGQNVVQYLYDVSLNALGLAQPVIATGKLTNDLAVDADQQVDVTGHSLGGHLSLAFNTLFSSVTNEVTSFNAPGFTDTPTNQGFFGTLGGAVPDATNSQNVTNIIADEASVGDAPWNAIAGLHDLPGETFTVSIEDQAGLNSDEPEPAGARNHSQQILTDSLAVYNLLTQLAPTLSLSEYKTILNQAAIGTSAGYERVVDVLETLFSINNTPLPTGNSNSNRDEIKGSEYLKAGQEFNSL